MLLKMMLPMKTIAAGRGQKLGLSFHFCHTEILIYKLLLLETRKQRFSSSPTNGSPKQKGPFFVPRTKAGTSVTVTSKERAKSFQSAANDSSAKIGVGKNSVKMLCSRVYGCVTGLCA